MNAVFAYGEYSTVHYTPVAAVTAGSVVVVGDLALVAHHDIAAGKLGALASEDGVYKMTADGAIAEKLLVYWDAAAGKVTRTVAGNKLFGYTVTASTADGDVIEVQHDPSADGPGPGSAMTTGAGAGITAGVGTVVTNSVELNGSVIKTSIFIDLTGLASSTTDLDIIGVGVLPAYIGRILAAQQGTVDAVKMTCLEAPAGGIADIDLYSATEGTGKFDDAVTGLTETALLTSGGAWANGTVKAATVVPAANDYLYLTGGAGGTAATYTAGKFLIEIFGH
jgi:predicted RecA/RadA family phage recombinase